MAKLRVIRNPEWINSARKIRVYLDGQKIGTILNGEIKEFDVPAGQHILQVKIDWCGSNALACMITEKRVETVTISSGFKSGLYLLSGLSGLIAIHFVLKIGFGIDLLILFAIPAAFTLIYFLTIGRNKYLQIRKDS